MGHPSQCSPSCTVIAVQDPGRRRILGQMYLLSASIPCLPYIAFEMSSAVHGRTGLAEIKSMQILRNVVHLDRR